MDQIPKIFVINLPHRTDRLESITKELDKLGLLDKMEIVEGVVIKVEGKLGTAGVAEARARCIELAQQRGYELIMILEDDCKFLCSREQLEDELQTFFNTAPDDWNGLWFGSFYSVESSNQFNWLYTKHFVHDTGSIIHSRFYSKLIDIYRFCRDKYIETGDEMFNTDSYMGDTNTPIYLLKNKLCGQADCMSDRTFISMYGGCGMNLYDFKI